MTEYITYTAQRVMTDVQDKFGDNGQVQLTNAMLIRWINDGQRFIAREADTIESVATTGILAGVALYDLTTLIVGQRVKMIQSFVVNGSRLEQVGFSEYQELIGQDGGVGTGTPTEAMARQNSVTLIPTPNATIANGLTVYFSQWPADVASPTDTLTVPDRFFDVLSDYVLAQAAKMNDDLSTHGQLLQSVTANITNQYEREHAAADDIYPVVPSYQD